MTGHDVYLICARIVYNTPSTKPTSAPIINMLSVSECPVIELDVLQ
jgi:hypothetical protein